MPRNDYTKAQRDAWQANRLAGERARAKSSSLTAQIDAALKPNAPPPPKAGHNSRRSKPLVADTDGSTCFTDLRYSGGFAYGTFTDGTSYSWPCSASEFKEWRDDNSLGGYFNENIRE